jgi:hypothetical protein
LDFSTKLVNTYEPLVSKLDSEFSKEHFDVLEAEKENILEVFLDQVFGYESFLARADFEKALIQK